MGLELYSISSYEKKCIVTLSISYDLVTNNSKSSVTMTQIWFVFFLNSHFFIMQKHIITIRTTLFIVTSESQFGILLVFCQEKIRLWQFVHQLNI